jgi:hypothetical protein
MAIRANAPNAPRERRRIVIGILLLARPFGQCTHLLLRRADRAFIGLSARFFNPLLAIATLARIGAVVTQLKFCATAMSKFHLRDNESCVSFRISTKFIAGFQAGKPFGFSVSDGCCLDDFRMEILPGQSIGAFLKFIGAMMLSQTEGSAWGSDARRAE